MTNEQIGAIVRLQRQGLGYKKIAVTLGLPVNGVKTYCRRHPVEEITVSVNTGVCLNCGATVAQTLHRKEKKFCSDKCRSAWWAAHSSQADRKAYYTHVCPQCGELFKSYGRKPRIYCSRECYAHARRKAVPTNG